MPGQLRRAKRRPTVSSLLFAFSLASLALGTVAPGARPAAAAVPRSVTVTPDQATMTAGQARAFRAFLNYADGSTQEITAVAQWTSGERDVALVSTTAGSIGLVTAVGPGQTKISAAITVDAAKFKGSAQLTVLAPPLAAITTKPTTKKLEVGLDAQFKATALYVNELTADVTGDVDWSSTNPAVATIENTGPKKGLVHPITAGATTIVARDLASGVANTDGDTLVRAAVTDLTIEPKDVTLARRLRLPLRCYANRTDGTRSNISSDVEWLSFNPAVVTVGIGGIEGGVVTAVANGKTTIRAVDPKRNLSTGTSGGDATVTVAGRLVGLEIQPTRLTVAVGDSKGARAVGLLGKGGKTSDLSEVVDWSIGHSSIATVDDTPGDKGSVTGVRPGTTTLRAVERVTGVASTQVDNVKVLGALQSIAMDDGDGMVGLGETAEYKVRATYEGGETTNLSDKCDWSVDKPRIASVDNRSPNKGVVTGLRKGEATVHADCDGRSAQAPVRVLGVLTSLEVVPGAFDGESLTEKKFHAIGHYDGGKTRDLTKVASWSSSNRAVVDVDDTEDPGLAQLLQSGVARLTASHPGGLSAFSDVTVAPGLLTLQIVPSGKTIKGSTKLRMRAQGKRADGSIQVVSKKAVWSSSNNKVARVSNRDGEQGAVFGGGEEGTATIQAALATGLSATATVNVAILLASFELIPEARTIPLLEARYIRALGRFTDASTKVITQSVLWMSSDPSVALVSNEPGSQGLVTAVARGTATVTAFDPSSGKAADNPVPVTVP